MNNQESVWKHLSSAAPQRRLSAAFCGRRAEQAFVLLLLGASLALVRPCAASPFAFDYTGSMKQEHSAHSSTLLQNGKVLVVGGTLDQSAGAELYDPSSATWTNANRPLRGRYDHTATLLLDGKVLVTGGQHSGFLASCEVYDPSTGTWSDTNNLTVARYGHTATLLSDGRVLVVGGFSSSGFTASAELYDPTEQTWTPTGSLSDRRGGHTATLLPNGKVLVAGGAKTDTTGVVYFSSCELYDPSTGTWSATGSLGSARWHHSTTLLPNGKLLMAGGFRGENTLASAQLYDPATGAWTNTGTLGIPRTGHIATLLPNGKVLVAAGETGDIFNDTPLTATAELFDPSTGTWTTTDSLAQARSAHTATLLATGKVLVAGGAGNPSVVATAELYDPSNGSWFATGSTVAAHAAHTATILPNGQVLVTGGTNGSATLGNTELYNVSTAQWLTTTSLNAVRKFHTATLLQSGKVLVAGGAGNNALASAELYDNANATWTNTGSLNTSRYNHTATLLSNGKVLVAGGARSAGNPPTTTYVASAEIYDPASATWTVTGSLSTGRHNHTATLLPSGEVLVSGGSNANNNFLATSALYNPATGAWTATGSLITPRELHTATLLPNGKVLVAGGTNDANAQGIVLKSVEIYDPATGVWTVGPSMSTARVGHTATSMADGRLLIYGGVGDGNSYLTTAELYDPAINKWSAAGSSAARFRHTATLLPNGRVLAVGGFFGSNTATINASFYDPGFAFLRPTWQPQILSAFVTTNSSGQQLFVAGSRFQGLSEGSGGNTQNSATNYPVVQLRSVDSGQVKFFSVDPAFGWSDQLFESVRAPGFPSGPALVTVFTDGIPSDSYYLTVDSEQAASVLANISTRLPVLGGDNVLIAGVIPTGSGSKKVLIRAIGPTLSDFGVPGALSDPTLELFQGSTSIATNDDWRNSTQQAEIQNSGLAPGKDAESAIIANLTAGQPYTAALRGKNGTTGVGLVEVFDLDTSGPSKLANISTRGFVGLDADVMIAGVIVAPANGPSAKVVVRALGPTLSDFGVQGALTNPTLDLVNSSGTVIRSNDDWKSSQQADIETAQLAPRHDEEAALIETIQPGQYTAVVRGVGRTTGAGLVEVYNIQ